MPSKLSSFVDEFLKEHDLQVLFIYQLKNVKKEYKENKVIEEFLTEQIEIMDDKKVRHYNDFLSRLPTKIR